MILLCFSKKNYINSLEFAHTLNFCFDLAFYQVDSKLTVLSEYILHQFNGKTNELRSLLNLIRRKLRR